MCEKEITGCPEKKHLPKGNKFSERLWALSIAMDELEKKIEEMGGRFYGKTEDQPEIYGFRYTISIWFDSERLYEYAAQSLQQDQGPSK